MVDQIGLAMDVIGGIGLLGAAVSVLWFLTFACLRGGRRIGSRFGPVAFGEGAASPASETGISIAAAIFALSTIVFCAGALGSMIFRDLAHRSAARHSVPWSSRW